MPHNIEHVPTISITLLIDNSNHIKTYFYVKN